MGQHRGGGGALSLDPNRERGTVRGAALGGGEHRRRGKGQCWHSGVGGRYCPFVVRRETSRDIRSRTRT